MPILSERDFIYFSGWFLPGILAPPRKKQALPRQASSPDHQFVFGFALIVKLKKSTNAETAMLSSLAPPRGNLKKTAGRSGAKLPADSIYDPFNYAHKFKTSPQAKRHLSSLL